MISDVALSCVDQVICECRCGVFSNGRRCDAAWCDWGPSHAIAAVIMRTATQLSCIMVHKRGGDLDP